MLREAKSAGWTQTGAWFWKRHRFGDGNAGAARGITRSLLSELELAQREAAVPVLEDERGRTYWWCLDRFFWEDEGLSAQDVFALVYERRLRAQRKLERAHAAVAQGHTRAIRREGVSKELRLAVWARDRGRCVECASAFELQFDHIIPVAMGGATTLENLQVLCGDCNRAKGASLG